jgi:hypothetical protein
VNEELERKRFEEWMKPNNVDHCTTPYCDSAGTLHYENSFAHLSWEAWKAALTFQLPETVKVHGTPSHGIPYETEIPREALDTIPYTPSPRVLSDPNAALAVLQRIAGAKDVTPDDIVAMAGATVTLVQYLNSKGS